LAEGGRTGGEVLAAAALSDVHLGQGLHTIGLGEAVADVDEHVQGLGAQLLGAGQLTGRAVYQADRAQHEPLAAPAADGAIGRERLAERGHRLVEPARLAVHHAGLVGDGCDPGFIGDRR
jgi:hypothetical protein